jgi:hypothetical protein
MPSEIFPSEKNLAVVEGKVKYSMPSGSQLSWRSYEKCVDNNVGVPGRLSMMLTEKTYNVIRECGHWIYIQEADCYSGGPKKSRGDNRKAVKGSQRARDAARKRNLGPARNTLEKHIGNGLSRPSGRVGVPGTAQSDERGAHGLPCPERNLRVYLTGGALDRDLKRNLLTMLWPGLSTPSRRNTRR